MAELPMGGAIQDDPLDNPMVDGPRPGEGWWGWGPGKRGPNPDEQAAYDEAMAAKPVYDQDYYRPVNFAGGTTWNPGTLYGDARGRIGQGDLYSRQRNPELDWTQADANRAWTEWVIEDYYSKRHGDDWEDYVPDYMWDKTFTSGRANFSDATYNYSTFFGDHLVATDRWEEQYGDALAAGDPTERWKGGGQDWWEESEGGDVAGEGGGGGWYPVWDAEGNVTWEEY